MSAIQLADGSWVDDQTGAPTAGPVATPITGPTSQEIPQQAAAPQAPVPQAAPAAPLAASTQPGSPVPVGLVANQLLQGAPGVAHPMGMSPATQSHVADLASRIGDANDLAQQTLAQNKQVT